MTQDSFGYLFKIRNVNFDNTEYEVWELVDFVFGLNYTSTNQQKKFVIYTGKYLDKIATLENFYVSNNHSTEYVVKLVKTIDAIKANENGILFNEIRDMHLKNSSKYYIRQIDELRIAKDKKLIAYLDNLGEEDYEIMPNSETNISEMYENIRKTVISQDEQIAQILTAIYKNQKVINSNIKLDMKIKLKENILLCGSTGTGKTEILRRIANFYGVSIVIEDATSFSETGYVGRNISDMLSDLYLAADRDINKAEKGILVIDEFDKLAYNKLTANNDVSRGGVQRSLLKLLDGSTYYFDKSIKSFQNHDTEKQKFNTELLTIVCIGAFSGIVDNLNKLSIGFKNNIDNNINSSYKNLKMEHFVNYGIMQELMGRFSKIVPMNSLSKDDLKNILIYSNLSPFNTYKKLFEEMNIEFEYNDDFIEWVTEQAILLGSGARGLKTIVDECIDSALFEIFAGDYSKIKLIREDNNSKSYVLTKK